MSFYRSKYLKSDHWKDLRLRKLVAQKGMCALCKRAAFNHDVHHVDYRKLYDVRMEDLRVLCRECHDKVHEFMDAHPEVKKLKGFKQWSAVQRALWKTYTVWKIEPQIKEHVWAKHRQNLIAARNRLLQNGVIDDPRIMPRHQAVYRRMTRIGYASDLDILRVCLSVVQVQVRLDQCGEH